jgi:phage shock protein A
MNAHINSLIDQVENHEAVAEAALGEIQESLLKAKFQLRRIQNEQKKLQEKIHQCRDEESKWRERAIRSEKEDRERAIECVRRMKKLQDETATLTQQANEHAQLERQLTSDVNAIEAKFDELKRRRSALAARESRAEAFQSVHRNQSGRQVEDAFERWERTVMRTEISAETSSPESVDSLTEQFSSEEERKDLEAMLSELVSK